jgi:hypothetical protein
MSSATAAPIGVDVAVPALREALRPRKTTPSEISACAIRGGVWNALRPYLEAFTADVGVRPVPAGQHARRTRSTGFPAQSGEPAAAAPARCEGPVQPPDEPTS